MVLVEKFKHNGRQTKAGGCAKYTCYLSADKIKCWQVVKKPCSEMDLWLKAASLFPRLTVSISGFKCTTLFGSLAVNLKYLSLILNYITSR